jgi:outer membrane scaffolding protein for murein synthesis (MipA/OmpV family)
VVVLGPAHLHDALQAIDVARQRVAADLGPVLRRLHARFVLALEPDAQQRVADAGRAVAEARVAYSDAVGPVFYSVGPRAKWASENYTQSFFGVNATQSARKGIAQYSADAGLVSYGVGGFARMPLTGNVALTGFAGYDRMGDVATDSSFIKQEGEANQFALGAGLSYKFGWDN